MSIARVQGNINEPFTSQPWRDAGSCRVCALLVAQNGSQLAKLRSLYCEKRAQYRFLWIAEDYRGTYAKGMIHVQADKLSADGRSSTHCEWASEAIHVKSHPSSRNVPRLERLAGSTSSSGTIETIKQWIHECNNDPASHRTCRKLAERTPEDRWWRPKRLLDIDSLDRFQVIGLNQRAQCSELVTYATLSYSWGTHGNLKLERNVNYEEWRANGIPWNDIPQVIQEAIQVTKNLGIRFLWVDALCLMQGEEWQYESTEMAKTYSLGYFNIVADAAHGCRSSMFDKRDPKSVLFSGALVQPSKEKGGILQSSRTTDLWLGPADPWESITIKSHTKSRAWIMQEELLAQRRIHFAQDQVFWECTAQSGCETFPGGLAGASSDILSHEFAGLRLGVVLSKRNWGAGSVTHIFEPLWLLIIEEYTARRCTAQSDRLIAVAGIAEVFGQLPQAVQSKNRYLAGLWLNRLEWFLCWHIKSVDQYSKHTNDYIGPSWSWASAVGSIRMDVLSEVPKGDHWNTVQIGSPETLIEPINAVMQTAPGLSSYYSVTSSSLRLRGHLFAVQIRERPAKA